MLPDAAYSAQSGRLARGDALVLYTDGVVEARSSDLSVGIDRMLGQADLLVTNGFRGGAQRIVDWPGPARDRRPRPGAASGLGPGGPVTVIARYQCGSRCSGWEAVSRTSGLRRGRSARSGRPGRPHQVHHVEPLAQLAGLGVPEPDPVAGQQAGGRLAAQRGLHLAGALGAEQPQAGRPGRPRQPRAAGRARGDVAAAERGRDPRVGPADDRQGEPRGRAAGEGPVAVEQPGRVQARPGRHLGHRGVGGVDLQAAGAAAVDQARAAARHLVHGAQDGGTPGAQLAPPSGP